MNTQVYEDLRTILEQAKSSEEHDNELKELRDRSENIIKEVEKLKVERDTTLSEFSSDELREHVQNLYEKEMNKSWWTRFIYG